ncbi:MAG: cobalamin biosynthesis protein CobW [Proteobacteria bacterium]|nr:cobalamin biosynthesis protein CobW [Pseudomonadota bacterium]MDA1070085.1 cobalamin biosynthesis protein CobW [Pseudomonadota bacterium]
MNLAPKIPATVITGFLGAGKTTLIRHLIQNAGGKRFAFVINEFGDLGVDREVIRGCGYEDCKDEDIVELANGCICCTVADDFLPTIQALLDRADPPDHIIIETSGLALPKPLIKAFAWPEVKTRVTVDGVIAVIDGRALADGRFADDPAALAAQRAADPNLDHENPLEEVFEEQVMAADMIVLNKTDLMDAGQLVQARRMVDEARRAPTKVVMATSGGVDIAVLLGLGAAAEDDLDSRPSHHDGVDGEHDHDDFDTFTVHFDPVTDVEALESRLKQVVAEHDVLRVKGFLEVPGKAMRHVVQGVGGRFDRYFDRPWTADEPRRSELVVIGLKGLDRQAITTALGGRA